MAGSKLLQGKVAVITGAGRGIGQSIAETYAAEGATVVLTARSEDQLAETAKNCKAKGAAGVEVHSVDLSDIEATSKFAKDVLGKHSMVHVLVNNAGRGVKEGPGPVEGNPAVWDNVLKLNVLAPMHLMQLFAPPMQKAREGLILNVCSVAGLEPIPAMPVYCASKFALRGYTLSTYEVFRKQNIKVVLIHPGPVATAMTEGMGDQEKMIQPQDVAEAALLPLRTTGGATPKEITIDVTEPIK